MFSALALVAAACAASPGASAKTITIGAIDAQEDIYKAAGPDGSDGVAPTIIDVSGLSSLTFSVPASDKITLNSGGNFNDPDGVGSADADSYNTGANGIAGLTAPNDGFLAGVFLGPTVSPKAPAALTFAKTDFLSLSPELQQAFFIGDGLTGDGSGAVQTFYVPAGATRLVLGISDACFYHGSPSCYGDNTGMLSSISLSEAAQAVSPVPLPASAPMFGAALAALGLFGYGVKRKSRAAA